MTDSILDRPASELPADLPRTVLVAGASGGIGEAFCSEVARLVPSVELVRLARTTSKLQRLPINTRDISFDYLADGDLAQSYSAEDYSAKDFSAKDIGDQETLFALPHETLESLPPVDWIFIATGWLHDDRFQPEKTYRNLSADQLLLSYRINALGPVLLLKQLLEHLQAKQQHKHPLTIGILSARVGSISDNRLGGWHSYRASKAALNMLIKNYAIEFRRLRRPWTICGLQPGTTDTSLSAPFQRNLSPDQLQSVDYTAAQLFKVMRAMNQSDSGRLIDFLGFPFEP